MLNSSQSPSSGSRRVHSGHFPGVANAEPSSLTLQNVDLNLYLDDSNSSCPSYESPATTSTFQSSLNMFPPTVSDISSFSNPTNPFTHESFATRGSPTGSTTSSSSTGSQPFFISPITLGSGVFPHHQRSAFTAGPNGQDHPDPFHNRASGRETPNATPSSGRGTRKNSHHFASDANGKRRSRRVWSHALEKYLFTPHEM